ncbi:hypothetical protein XELAEV_18032521mg [Xenopus laevis]|uniref:Uncharacterized protein n=1 Tax=Xenopus laevis TaxID=8355 RepID=A0A974CS20_XENLA|nr:hypothetical protein XELAEV_18032521mg [Xenopus laevis]
MARGGQGEGFRLKRPPHWTLIGHIVKLQLVSWGPNDWMKQMYQCRFRQCDPQICSRDPQTPNDLRHRYFLLPSVGLWVIDCLCPRGGWNTASVHQGMGGSTIYYN